jgi:hypothetical protein
MCGGFNGVYLNNWNVFEYSFKVRTYKGLYDEKVYYPLKYNGAWQLYQECTDDDCYAGVAIKTTENLGNFCYASLLNAANENLILYDNKKGASSFILLQRKFSLSFQKKAQHAVGIRLFVTKEEVENLISTYEKSANRKCAINDIKILQRNTQQQFAHLANDDIGNYKIISPQPYSYGVQQQTIIFSFDANDIASEFYIALQVK